MISMITEPTPPESFWARGPLGRSAKAVHLWDEPEAYTWRSRCGKYTFSERKPAGEPGGNRCPTCVEREQPAQALPPGSSPTIPDDLAALGWTLQSNLDGDRWMVLHRAAAVSTAPGALEVAITRAYEIEAHAADPDSHSDPPANYLRIVRQMPALALAEPDPALQAERKRLETLGWTFAELSKEQARGTPVRYWRADHPGYRRPGGTPLTVYGGLETTLREVHRMITESLPLDHIFAVDGPEQRELPVEQIIPGRYQPRTVFDPAALDELAGSIREHGILNRLVVIQNEHGQFELVAGERRLRAAKQVGLAVVPVEVRAYTLAQVQEVSIIDNLLRVQLSDVEEGRAYNRLIDELGLSENKLAQRLGKNRSYIQQRRAIAQAAPEVQQALEAGRITVSQARALAMAAPGDHAVQQTVLTQVERDQKLGTAQTEERVRERTVRTAAETHKKALRKLGYRMLIEEYSYKPPLIWSKCDRPQVWTGAEIISTVQQGRKPTGTPVAATVDPLDVALLRGWSRGLSNVVATTYAPWIATTIGADGKERPLEYLSPEELHARCAALRQEFVEPIRAQLAAQGWTLALIEGGTEGGWTITHDATDYQLTAWNWLGVKQHAQTIAAGQVDTSQPAPRSSVRSLACVRCGATENLTYIGGLISDYLCQAHALEARADLERLRAERREGCAAIFARLTDAGDLEALRLLLLWFCSNSSGGQEALGLTGWCDQIAIAEHLLTLDAAAIRQAAVQVFTDRAIDHFGSSLALGRLLGDVVAQVQEAVNG